MTDMPSRATCVTPVTPACPLETNTCPRCHSCPPVSLSKGRFSPEMEKYRSRFDRGRIRCTSAYVLLSEPGSLSDRETLQKHLCPTVALRSISEAVQLSRRSRQKRGIVHGRAPEEPRSIRTGIMWIESPAPRGSYRTRPAGAQLSRSADHEHP